MNRRLIEGSDAIAEAAIAAGCRFFAGYPMLPFTDLLEAMSTRLAAAGGVCMNAETEMAGANMALGAAATGARAATGSTGQGVALMQEAIAEAALNETPLVIFTMARGQQDYFQCTRGGGWGDYRTPTLAPKDVAEAVEHTQLLFHLSDVYRTPSVLYGDYLIGQVNVTVDVSPIDFGPWPDKDWALDGRTGGTGRSKVTWTWNMGKKNTPGPGPHGYWPQLADKYVDLARAEARHEAIDCDDAETVIVSFGTTAPFVEYVVKELRSEGVKVGSFRPVTLWPYPYDALAAATKNARAVLVFELNAGQMIDDVLIGASDRSVVRSIGGVSQDPSGMRQGALLDVNVIRDRVLEAIGKSG